MAGGIGALLCVLVFAILIGAVLIRAAVWLYNKFAGGPEAPSAVPDPDFGKAMAISLAFIGANFFVSLILAFMLGGAAAASGTSLQGSQIVGRLIGMPISYFVVATMFMVLLPTTFSRALLVALCYLLVCIVFAVCIGVIFFLIAVLAFHPR